MAATESRQDAPVEGEPVSRDGPLTSRSVLVVVVAVVVAVLALLWMAAESHYRSCLAAAEARYPAVPVSAFNTKATGPLKLSFQQERRAAVNDCGRLPL